MERKRKTGEVRYFAMDDYEIPFRCGRNAEKMFLAPNVEVLAAKIAYYTNRWSPTLMVLEGGRARKATAREQDRFDAALRAEFLFQESK